ncbi:MAG: lytic transglycosylase [Deltaproteobacteria bacterium HGW-Deltaproteobacteria-23]|nr:MAG: lytic transglycosylase [Deltaproteobacteria bacterium HGW-Deltaproteobacteria-23]
MRILILILAFLLLIAVSNNQASVNMNPETLAAFLQEQEQEKDKIERQQQLPAIVSVFARHTSRERAHRLAYLCYETTLDTPFKPIDLAELALAETGGHYLSNHAVSSEGALGVWQLMPTRAKSHGYKPAEMKQDDKCAEAAVKELKTKLVMADGNIQKAKRLYCGAGPQARQYELKTRKYRQQIMAKMGIIPSTKGDNS